MTKITMLNSMTSILSRTRSLLGESRWVLLQRGLSRRLPGKLLHDLRHRVIYHLALNFRCLPLLLVRVNGNSLTISFRVVELLG